jgi:hypothetical protein
LFEVHRGICAICNNKIEGSFICEHMRALGLGGKARGDNLVVAHTRCAELKTKADRAMIDKAKAQKKARHGIKRHAAPLKSRNDLPTSAQAEKRAKDRLPPSEGPTNLQRRYGIIEK